MVDVSGQYFIRCSLPGYDFFELDKTIYDAIDEQKPLLLETAPATNLFFCLKDTAGRIIPLK